MKHAILSMNTNCTLKSRTSAALIITVFGLAAHAQTPTYQYPAHNMAGMAASVVRSVAVAPDGSSLIAGYRQDTLDFGTEHLTPSGGAFVVKLDQQGGELWSRTGGSTTGSIGNSVAVDANGNVYFAGAVTAPFTNVFDGVTLAAGSAGFVVKYSATGTLQWATGLPGNVVAIAVDASGTPFINMGDASIQKLDPASGSELASIPVSGDLMNNWYHNAVIDGGGNVIVQLGNKITKFNNALVEQWSTPLTKPAGSAESYRISVDPNGNVLASFYALLGTVSLGGVDYSTFPNGYWYSLSGVDGTVQNCTLFNADGSANKPKQLIRDAAGNIYASADLSFNTPYVLKFDAALTGLWAKVCADVQDMALIADDCLLIGGRYSSTTTFDSYTVPRPNNSGQDNAYAVYLCDGGVGIDEPLDESTMLNILPNPAINEVRIGAVEGMQEIRVFSSSGAMMMVARPLANDNVLDVAHLPAGLYTVRDDRGRSARLVIAR